MITTTTKNNPGVKDPNTGYINKTTGRSEQDVTDTIINSFIEQDYLSGQFNQKIRSLIKSMAFTYPDTGAILQKTTDLFLDSSHQLLGKYMNKIYDLHMALKPAKPDTFDIPHETVHQKPAVTKIQNDHWMQDLIEQGRSIKTDSEIPSIVEAGRSDICYNVKVTEHFCYYSKEHD